jgi:hypothetical protein
MFSWNLETWPAQKVTQPKKGIIGLIIAFALTGLSYVVIVQVLGINAGIAGSIVWVFVSWLYTWDIVLGKWPADLSTGLPDDA